MNFDTKHLVRWGIPGWIMIMVLGPYLFFNFEEVRELANAGKDNLLAIGAFLTVIGVPLGYLLNQIHHSITWVIPKILNNGWGKYFEKEINLDEILSSDKLGEFKRERYRYLLSRKHELGGVTVSLGIACFTILIIKSYEEISHRWSWVYFGITLFLFILVWISRNYSSKNVDKYFKHYLRHKV